MKTFYTVYQVTNKINGKVYIGTHKTRDLDDDYMGSGKYLRRAIDKHGVENFTKEILFVFDNPEEMYAKEAEIVNEDFLSEANTYNLKRGGFGGWDHNNTSEAVEKRRWSFQVRSRAGSARFCELYNNDAEFRRNHQSHLKSIARAGSRAARIAYPEGPFKGRKHTEETKSIMSEKARQRLIDPTKNSQYGTRWIYSPEEKRSRKIRKEEPLPQGWREGRKIKF